MPRTVHLLSGIWYPYVFEKPCICVSNGLLATIPARWNGDGPFEFMHAASVSNLKLAWPERHTTHEHSIFINID
jgi:hypothetical protein